MNYQIVNSVIVNGIEYNAIARIEMLSAREMPIDQLTVEFPQGYYDVDTFVIGDEVEWVGGYSGDTQTEFIGEITEIKSFYPLTIVCKDNMLKLKKKLCVRNFSNHPIQDFFDSVLPSGISANVESNIESDTISCYCNDKTVLWALKDLKTRYNIDSFFRKGELVVQNSELISPDPGENKEFGTNKNVLDSNTRFMPEKSAKLTLKSFDPDSGKVNKTSIGDGDEEILISLDGIRLDKLVDKVTSIFKARTSAKLTGDFQAIAFPSAHHSEFVKYVDANAGLEGTAFVERVTKVFIAEQAYFTQRVFL